MEKRSVWERHNSANDSKGRPWFITKNWGPFVWTKVNSWKGRALLAVAFLNIFGFLVVGNITNAGPNFYGPMIPIHFVIALIMWLNTGKA